jgi:hypothetical protein
MTNRESIHDRYKGLPVILIAAVVQGWSLYGLHVAIKDKLWPATEPSWLLGCYAITVLIPLTVQMLATSIRDKQTWLMLSGMAAVFFYFGWHHGGHVVDIDAQRFEDQWLPFGFVLAVLWLLVLPFLQGRIETKRWRMPYVVLFANAWNNKLMLFEACLFTGLFWLLLLLWQKLFAMLGIEFFKDLFSEPLFIYPVTSITFGVALHLIGSLDRLTRAVLEQLLNVLKWLVILAAIILTLFTIALATKLPGMIASGERAIGAAWLLWLVAVTVLLVNAAFRDGSVERPYPHAIATGLRFVIPLTALIALTALYALYLRIDRYGLTVDRVWACIVATTAAIYSFGYALAARDKQWMAGIARVNVLVALFLIGVIALALTPLLSPHRLAAQAQFARVLAEWPRTANDIDNPLHYLRFSAGQYGNDRLQDLLRLEAHPQAETIRNDTKTMMEDITRWSPTVLPSDVEAFVSSIVIRPKDRALTPELRSTLNEAIKDPEQSWMYLAGDSPPLGLFIDMDANGTEEFVLFAQLLAVIFEHREGRWSFAGQQATQTHPQPNALQSAVDANDVGVIEPRWKNVRVGGHTFREVQGW